MDSIRDNFESDEEVINLLNSNLPDNTIKNKIIKMVDNDIVYGEDYYNIY